MSQPITTEQIKELRVATDVSVMQCKKALEEAEGDFEKALVLLKKKSSEAAAKKSDRALASGTVASYIHAGGSIGAMVTLLCETDFVAKNEDFKALAYDIAMHTAAQNPEFLTREDMSPEAIATARAVFEKEASDKPDAVREKVIEGKMDAYYKERVLLEQTFIKDPTHTITALVSEAVQKFGENIELARFVRMTA
jgi:elongation factor Ts